MDRGRAQISIGEGTARHADAPLARHRHSAMCASACKPRVLIVHQVQTRLVTLDAGGAVDGGTHVGKGDAEERGQDVSLPQKSG
jgi:hypothetical protein